MDAHTLNAWTRFALQKGGIGSCTALVDNPATDPEDLMFMTGEKIIVLRRLDNDDLAASAGSSGRRKSTPDADSCFLGYCEGVVGRFKGSHVQIHGKLKKPVLMRRSGQGQIRDSSTKLLSQQAAASLPASQVPAGIPVTAVDSDGEEGPRRKSVSPAGQVSPVPGATNGSQPSYRPSATQTSRPAADANDSDSDDSDTMLPWARMSSSGSSDGEGVGRNQRTTLQTSFLAPGSNFSPQRPSPTDSLANSSFSHASSMTQSANSHQAKSPSQSTLSSSTSASDDDHAARRDQTFSIYDVYGRDSVAFPNFNLVGKDLAEGINGLGLDPSMANTPVMPGGFKASPRDLRPAAAKRPNAAPDPRAPPHQGSHDPRVMASFLRQQVEASATNRSNELAPPGARSGHTISAPTSPAVTQDSRIGGSGSPIGFDPKRRPSGRVNAPPHLPQIRIPGAATGNQVPGPLSPHGPRPAPGQMGRPISPVSGPQGPRPGPASAAAGPYVPSYPASGPPMAAPPTRGPMSAVSPTGAYFPPGVQPTSLPVRSTSDRSSERERSLGGPLRKNTSPNPGYAPMGPSSGDTAHSFGSSSNGLTPVAQHGPGRRSPNSPNGSITSPIGNGERGPGGHGPAPNGMAAQLRAGSPAPSTHSGRSGGPRRPEAYDAKGFVLGSGVPCRPLPEDRDTLEKWQSILAEDDLAAARKSRKVKKLVQAGIPNSIRGKVWLFLANGGVRRRQGLFEQLCRTSQEAKKGRKGKEAAYDAIEKDVPNTFPDNKVFQEGQPGRADLEAILKAYTHYNPIIGYTQGMDLLVGIFLLHMAPEDAFWLLCALLRDVHLEGYYSKEMKQLHIDGVMFGQLLHSLDASLATHLQSMNLEPVHFTPKWFLPLYCRVLPWPTLLRVMDMFFYEGELIDSA
ncbi:hypothetical protein BCV69DRAFT_145774 [Microstroma glucosiphilum]|uniref:Rab-GAP TBC domain-containing protein n=1 Tax=Pseudomicrostroma glucosiphilum TaxID=1684307 RepID=A0A316UDR3_9BASI|nr:hypothetical protein BCV69DRAFT_145774 [Pseudomicrostroma glucosiphilum]PWN22513.1 hypothetical protein BCV69DRAFT_145774 [Pseudomicrostroma glucosiphilum]